MKNILKILGLKATGRHAPLLGEAMVPNSAGGYVYALDDWARLDRFLVLGTEGGTCYASERKLTVEAAQAVMDCVAADGQRAVARIVEMSVSGRAPKQDPVLFALALNAFVIYTDSETWAGAVHPAAALRRYREATGIAARLVVVGLTSRASPSLTRRIPACWTWSGSTRLHRR